MPRPLLSWIAPPPMAPRHVETFTVDPPRSETAPVIVETLVLPGRIETIAVSVGVTEPAEESEPLELAPVVEPRVDALPPLVARLVTCAGDREDLIKDQALPPVYAVVERAGRAVAHFHGAEHAAKLARILSPKHAVVRIADLELMTDVQVPKGWRP